MTVREQRSAEVAKSAAELEPVFRRANVLTARLDDAKSASARGIRIGRFLMPNIGRTVPITVQGRPAAATLRTKNARARQKLYYFDVYFTDLEDDTRGSREDAPGKPAGPKAGAPSSQIEPAQAVTTPVQQKYDRREVSGNDEVW